MKIDLTNPPKYLKCLKSFYGFEIGDIFTYDKASPEMNYISPYYRLDYTISPEIRATGSFVHFDLLEALEEGYFIEYIPTPEEAFESELNEAANRIKDEVPTGTGGGDRVKIGFREGVKWYQKRIKNK
jgi:hypothetical protein